MKTNSSGGGGSGWRLLDSCNVVLAPRFRNRRMTWARSRKPPSVVLPRLAVSRNPAAPDLTTDHLFRVFRVRTNLGYRILLWLRFARTAERTKPMPEYVVIATWPFGQTAVETAAPLLRQGKPALDAVIAGAQAVEDDPTGPLGRLRRPAERHRHRAARRLRHGRPDARLRRRGRRWRTSATPPPWPGASWRRRRTSCWSAKAPGCSPCSRAFRWRT